MKELLIAASPVLGIFFAYYIAKLIVSLQLKAFYRRRKVKAGEYLIKPSRTLQTLARVVHVDKE